MALFSLNSAFAKPATNFYTPAAPAPSTSYSIPTFTKTATPTPTFQNMTTAAPIRSTPAPSFNYTPTPAFQATYQPTSAITPISSFYKPAEPTPQFVNPYTLSFQQPTSQITPPKPAASSTATAPTGWNPNSPMLQPGYYENWYNQNQSRYSQPTTLSQYYNQIQGRVLGQNYQPTNAQDAYTQMQAGMGGGTGVGTGNAYSVSQQLRNDTVGEQYMNQAAGMLRGNNMAYNYADQALTSGFFDPNNPGNAASWYQAWSPELANRMQGENQAYNTELRGLAGDAQLTDPGRLENLWATDYWKFVDPGQGERAALDMLLGGDWGNVNFGQQGLEYAQGQTQDPLASQSALDKLRPLLEGRSYSENLIGSDPGLDRYYDYQRARQTEDLQNQMAAMGVFGSGETVEGMARIRDALGAEQANREADYRLGIAGQADEAMLGRAGLLGNLSSTVDAASMARLNAMLGAYGMASGEALSNQGMQLGAAGQMLDVDRLALDRLLGAAGVATGADQMMLARLGMRGDLIQAADQLGLQADQLGINRALAGGQLAGQADASELERILGGGTLANMGQSSLMNQASALGNIGAQSAQAQVQRLLGSSSAGLSADAEQRARLTELFNAGQGVDALRIQGSQNDLSWLTVGANMAGNVDTGNLNLLNSGANAAQTAQTMFENRNLGMFTNAQSLGSAMAGVYKDLATATTEEQGAMKTAAVQLLMSKYGLTAAQAQEKANAWMAAGQNPLKMAESFIPGT